jgi:hypothetical protein
MAEPIRHGAMNAKRYGCMAETLKETPCGKIVVIAPLSYKLVA